jgi:hypothetical protein
MDPADPMTLPSLHLLEFEPERMNIISNQRERQEYLVAQAEGATSRYDDFVSAQSNKQTTN